MKRKELLDRIKGAYLKGEHLEAFLAQSAYIEGALKLYSNFSFFKRIIGVIPEDKKDKKYLRHVEKKIEGLRFNDQINFLGECDLLTKNLVKDLHDYRIKRNKVMHELLREIEETNFNNELKKVCKLGQKIMEGSEFMSMEGILKAHDEIWKTIRRMKRGIKVSPKINKTSKRER